MVDFNEEEKIEFDFNEEENSQKLIYTIFGDKGSGKTTSALSFDGRIVAISFDHKTVTIKNNFYNNEKPIKVYDGVRYYEKTPDKILKTAKITYEYVTQILQKFVNAPEENKPDWILIDGLEIINSVCEMAMRNDRGYKPFAGISNMNDWKYRNIMMDQIHNYSYNACKKGVIYTTYSKIENLEVENGEIVLSKEIPKWFGNVMLETDIVLKTFIRQGKDGQQIYMVDVKSSKYDDLMQSGKKYFVTKEGFKKDEN